MLSASARPKHPAESIEGGRLHRCMVQVYTSPSQQPQPYGVSFNRPATVAHRSVRGYSIKYDTVFALSLSDTQILGIVV